MSVVFICGIPAPIAEISITTKSCLENSESFSVYTNRLHAVKKLLELVEGGSAYCLPLTVEPVLNQGWI